MNIQWRAYVVRVRKFPKANFQQITLGPSKMILTFKSIAFTQKGFMLRQDR